MWNYVKVDELKQFIYDLIKKDKAVGKEPDDDLFTILGHLGVPSMVTRSIEAADELIKQLDLKYN